MSPLFLARRTFLYQMERLRNQLPAASYQTPVNKGCY